MAVGFSQPLKQKWVPEDLSESKAHLARKVDNVTANSEPIV
jgi:hypothetical protein